MYGWYIIQRVRNTEENIHVHISCLILELPPAYTHTISSCSHAYICMWRN